MSLFAEKGELAKLSIFSFTNKEQKGTGETFTAYYNPTSFSSTLGITYNDKGTIGSADKRENNFNLYNPTTYSFDLIFDGTGASQPSGYKDEKLVDVATGKLKVDDAIQDFLAKCYQFDGTTHSPRYLLLVWGKAMNAKVLLTGITMVKDLFTASGDTLRAKLTCNFKEYSDKELANAGDRKSSPDLTHYRIVQQGDKLPLMCESIYGKADLYLEVARYNQLTNYRDLTPGLKIYFPPLVTSKK